MGGKGLTVPGTSEVRLSKMNPLPHRGYTASGTAPPPICLRASWGMLDMLRLGESLPHFPPQLRKVWAEKYSLSDWGRAGVSCPLAPHSQRSGREGAGLGF